MAGGGVSAGADPGQDPSKNEGSDVGGGVLAGAGPGTITKERGDGVSPVPAPGRGSGGSSAAAHGASMALDAVNLSGSKRPKEDEKDTQKA